MIIAKRVKTEHIFSFELLSEEIHCAHKQKGNVTYLKKKYKTFDALWFRA